MGEFGSVEGHLDCGDSAGALTAMVASSRLPPLYEAGRFHLLGLGVYIKLNLTTVTCFCGLNRHGGSPPIAPKGVKILHKKPIRIMGIDYSPNAMISAAGSKSMPLASLPNGVLLMLGPEVTTYL